MRKKSFWTAWILSAIMTAAVQNTVAAQEQTEAGTEAGQAADEQTYVYEEDLTFGKVPWTLTLNAEGTYSLSTEGPTGSSTFTGTYTTDGNMVTTSAPAEDASAILASFFNQDYSCDWVLGEDGSMVPAHAGEKSAAEGAIDVLAQSAGNEDADYTAVPYASESASQVMDIYLPNPATGSDPLVVIVHGGGFAFGAQDMELIMPAIEAVQNAGYVVASVDYRKSSEAVFPAALADVKAAIRYLRANASEYGIDADRIAIWGESAGGYLSLMTALTPEVEELNGDVPENSEYSSSVNALVTFYAPVEFYTMRDEYQSWGDMEDGAGTFESQFLGVEDIYSDQKVCEAAYWETYKDALPEGYSLSAWIQVGDENDKNVPYTQSVNFADRLQTVPGVTVHFDKISGAAHEDPAFYTDENLSEVLDFLDKALHEDDTDETEGE